ncbi:BglII/BstYI family type II restriction endonuclease [Galactobacillus timonensis]|uniref:BglII/BstYI family type II restriction endonuclease n=1 Tax=Galactobacillus timonensis TaxID=2041840 RepID=UPI000C81FBC5|nr:BglII/BstYI family type II restriction endonuclease [Galactobacillus timonensis]
MRVTIGDNELDARYEFYNYGHALEILTSAHIDEWRDICDCLRAFHISRDDIRASGGNESRIPKRIDAELYPRGWREIRIEGDLIVHKYVRQRAQRVNAQSEDMTLEHYIDGHNIDFINGTVALDLEWNSKDQTFDRDLLAMRTYFDCGVIDCGVILTRSEKLNDLFRGLGVMGKFGASTTWMGKLTYRLDSRRQGGCPILAIGIGPGCVID